jgi:hypothetical protein
MDVDADKRIPRSKKGFILDIFLNGVEKYD